MDLAYLRAHPQHLPAFLTHQRIRETPVPGGNICTAQRLTFEDGQSIFAKSLADAPPGFFAAEAAGLRWLASAGSVPVPEVIVDLPDMLALEWINAGPATPRGAERLGQELAAMHRAGAPAFGAEWPGYIGSLPLDNAPSTTPWPEWFATARLEPYLRRCVDDETLSGADAAVLGRVLDRIEDLAGPAGAEPPARIHGDLWPGNVLWSDQPRGRAWLIDPAAHGGHRETDLATLALFGGLPYLDALHDGYTQTWPLADGWRARQPLHQLHLLLVHAALFGGGFRGAVMAAAERYR